MWFLDDKNDTAQKRLFGKKNEAWHLSLSGQYTHFMLFSSKSEHDPIADQAYDLTQQWN